VHTVNHPPPFTRARIVSGPFAFDVSLWNRVNVPRVVGRSFRGFLCVDFSVLDQPACDGAGRSMRDEVA
jgi:hypothetical protein